MIHLLQNLNKNKQPLQSTPDNHASDGKTNQLSSFKPNNLSSLKAAVSTRKPPPSSSSATKYNFKKKQLSEENQPVSKDEFVSEADYLKCLDETMEEDHPVNTQSTKTSYGNLPKKKIHVEEKVQDKPMLAIEAPLKKKRIKESDKYDNWTENHKLLSIEPPLLLNQKNTNLRFKISFRYHDPSDGKSKRKTIRFGKKNQKYFVDDGDHTSRKKLMTRFKGYYTPFHKNFWVCALLSTEKNIYEAYTKLLVEYI